MITIHRIGKYKILREKMQTKIKDITDNQRHKAKTHKRLLGLNS